MCGMFFFFLQHTDRSYMSKPKTRCYQSKRIKPHKKTRIESETVHIKHNQKETKKKEAHLNYFTYNLVFWG